AQQATRPVAELEKQWDALREENDSVMDAIHKAQAGVKSVEEKMEGLHKRDEFLDAPAAACPLCLHPLQPHDHSRLRTELEEEKRVLQAKSEAFRRDGEKAAKDRSELKRRGNETKAALEEARLNQGQIIRLESELKTAQEAASALADLEKSLAAARQELTVPLDPSLEKRLLELQAIKAAAGYDRKAHEALKERARSLASADRENQELEHASRNRLEVQQNLQEMEARAETQENRRAALAAQLAPLAGVPLRRAELGRKIQAIELEKERTGRERSASQESVGRWTTLLEQCAEKEKQERAGRGEMAAASKDAAIYKELSTAFSKRGIQAMIIENIIPELEDEANRLLGRMTDHGMHIQFRTQRELKKGGGAETLDIVIGDELGDRPYECYSGGEAFRINFAIRIALSRLLARRAGARLQTIVIDEGFGSQDAQGRKRLVEAIESVKEEFTRILVITHLDDLKDEFPTRLYVSKDENGSRVTLLS
ncbi:MAG: SMC family ATPase, partial [Armatimonadota bacterium]|nr:SMC family ATPase [Armatimonadota bacterium]